VRMCLLNELCSRLCCCVQETCVAMDVCRNVESVEDGVASC
jgi:hypothetical protein